MNSLRKHPGGLRRNPAGFVLIFVFLLVTFSAVTRGQTPPAQPTPTPAAPPSTDIFLVEMSSRGGRRQFGKPVNITNREGYDNQPYFMPRGDALLFTSIREGAQADIYRYEIRTGQTSRLTETTEDEYSPTPTPDGKFFSTVRVEADKAQRLWKFPLKRGASPSLVLEKIKPVGYHAWVDDDTLALFVLGPPHTLQLADVRTGNSEVILENVGRSLHRIPRVRGQFSFVHKVSEKEWLIKTFDVKTRDVTILVPTLPESEDYVWTPDGKSLLMAKGSKLFVWHASRGATWAEAADFSSSGLKEITRLAISPKGDRLALVARP